MLRLQRLCFSEAILDFLKPFNKCCVYKGYASPKRFWIVKNLSTNVTATKVALLRSGFEFFKTFSSTLTPHLNCLLRFELEGVACQQNRPFNVE